MVREPSNKLLIYRLKKYGFFSISILSALFIGLLIVWINFPHFIDKVGKGLIKISQLKYKSELDTAINNIKNGSGKIANDQLKELLNHLEDVKPFDRLENIKVNALKELIRNLNQQSKYKEALDWTEKFQLFDPNNLWPKIKKISFLKKENSPTWKINSLIKNLYKQYPNSFEALNAYVDLLLSEGKLTQAFKESYQYWERAWEGMDKRYWQIYWDTGRNFNAGQMAGVFPKKSDDNRFQIIAKLPKGSYRKIRIDPVDWSRMLLSDLKITLKNKNQSYFYNESTLPHNFWNIQHSNFGLIPNKQDPQFWFPLDPQPTNFNEAFEVIIEGKSSPVYPNSIELMLDNQKDFKNLLNKLKAKKETKLINIWTSTKNFRNGIFKVTDIANNRHPIFIQLFWKNKNTPFKEQNSKAQQIIFSKDNFFEVTFPIKKKISQLRIDFPHVFPKEYKLNTIEINTRSNSTILDPISLEITTHNMIRQKNKFKSVGDDPFFNFRLPNLDDEIILVSLKGQLS